MSTVEILDLTDPAAPVAVGGASLTSPVASPTPVDDFSSLAAIDASDWSFSGFDLRTGAGGHPMHSGVGSTYSYTSILSVPGNGSRARFRGS